MKPAIAIVLILSVTAIIAIAIKISIDYRAKLDTQQAKIEGRKTFFEGVKNIFTLGII